MTNRGDVTSIKKIEPSNPGKIIPSQPKIPEGQSYIPRRQANPKLTTMPVTIRAAGGHILSRKWEGGAWGAWSVLSDQDIQVMIGEPPAPARKPYRAGSKP